jgi:predicted RNA-binding Zn-ribbon protein involved in translation (DUF1610 family)
VQLSKDSAKKGVVEKDNGSSQPYNVSWENGQHSREYPANIVFDADHYKKKIVDACRGWVEQALAIMFQDSGKLKIDIVAMTREASHNYQAVGHKAFRISNHPHTLNWNENLIDHNCDVCGGGIIFDGYRCSNACDFYMCMKCATGTNTLLAVVIDQIWSEDMLRDPSRVGGFSACVGCLPGCSDCSAGLPFFAAHDLCSIVSLKLASCLKLLEQRKDKFDNLHASFATFKADLNSKLAPQFEYLQHCGTAQEVLTGYSAVTKGTDSHPGQRDRVTTATAKRNHQMSEEQHKVADSELKLLRKNQAAK